ncbi:MAG TPA: hypothetical protein VEA78_10365 [Acidimicrobiales bacterium]|nr:hypothetical protein [Acidimicrobiales bacterium]
MADDHVHDPERSARFEEMIDRDQIAELLDEVGVTGLARAYSCHQRRNAEAGDVDWWAVDCLFWLNRLPLERHRHVVEQLVELVDVDHVGLIAAGPLEGLVWHDEDTLRWLEDAAARGERMRDAISGVWVDLPAEAMARLDAIATEPLDRPMPRDEWPDALKAYDAAAHALSDLARRMIDGEPARPGDEVVGRVAHDVFIESMRELQGDD